MAFEFPSLHLPSVRLPSFGELRARFTAFTGRVASALKSIGRSNTTPPTPLSSRKVEIATPPSSSPIKQLQTPVKPDRSQEYAELKKEVAHNTLVEKVLFDARMNATMNHVYPSETKVTNGVASASKQIVEGAQKDQQALAPAPLPATTDQPPNLKEPQLASVGHVIAKWDHVHVTTLAQNLARNHARLEVLQSRPPTPANQSQITALERENQAIADELGKLLGKAFKTLSPAEQQAFALGSGGSLKQELWTLLRHAAPDLPSWEYKGSVSDYGDGSEGSKDPSWAKQILDRTYNTAASQFGPQLSSDKPPVLTVNGKTYQHVKFLGQGGQGAAHLFYNAEEGRALVVKTMRASGDILNDDVDRARGEYKTHLGLMGANDEGHPNLLTIDDVGRTDTGLPFAVLDYAPGGDVKELLETKLPNAIKQGLVSPEAAHLIRLTVLQDSIKGMIYLQEQLGGRHSDFKPANVFVGADGSAKVADFGLTTFTPSEISTDRAEGTAQYMAPEQQIPGSLVTGKSDTWAIGIFAHDMFGKPRPFDANFYAQMREKVEMYLKKGDIEGARGVVTKMAENYDKTANVVGVTALDRLLNAMLHPDPDKRPSLSSVLESSLFDDLGRGENDRSPAVRELIQALTTNPPDAALIKLKSAALGV